MGFEEAAIQSIRANRGLQRKQSVFDTSLGQYTTTNLNIAKIPVDEAKMDALQKQVNLREMIFWLLGIIVGLGVVWWIYF